MCRLWTSLVGLGFAWLCLLQPQGLVVDAVHWLRGATHFSHQRRLAAELQVALARAALPADETTRVAAADDDAVPVTNPIAPVPTVTLGKISLVLAGDFELLPPSAEQLALSLDSFGAAMRTRDVPVPVPRV